MRIKLSWWLRFSCSDKTKEGRCFNRFSIRNFKNTLRFVKHHFHVDARLKCPIFFFFFWHIQATERPWWRKTWKENRSPHPESETRTSSCSWAWEGPRWSGLGSSGSVGPSLKKLQEATFMCVYHLQRDVKVKFCGSQVGKGWPLIMPTNWL